MIWREMLAEAKSLRERGLELFLLRGSLMAVHLESVCEAPCPVHAPSDHPMQDFPLIWRDDRSMFERACAHGMGHPDPDDLAFKRKVMRAEDYRARDYGTHGCCGVCCRG